MLSAPLSVLVASALALSSGGIHTQHRNAEEPAPEAAPAADPSWADEATSEEPTEPPADADAAGVADEAPPADPMTAPGAGTEPPPAAIDAPVATPPVGTPGELQVPAEKGTGLMIVAGGLGAVGWLLMAGRIGIIQARCKAEDPESTVTQDSVSNTVDDAGDCFRARGTNGALWAVQASANAANWAVAPLAAIKRAKYNAALDVKEGNAGPAVNGYIGGGAGLLAAGAIGRVAVVYFRIKGIRDAVTNLSSACLDGDTSSSEDFFQCYANRQTYFYLGHQASSAAIAAGAGLLTYGIVYKKRRAELERLHPGDVAGRAQFSIAPSLSPTYTGFSGTLRF